MFNPYDIAQVHFTKIKEIGQEGKNSRTFIATDHQLGADIVVKEIAKAKLISAASFFNESRALYTSTHSNVVQLHYACQDVDSVFIAMPFYAKGSVKPLITGAHVTVRQLVTLGCQVLSGLHNIHSKGLIHFDVKPDNIMISDRGDAMVSDFGLAKQMIGGIASPSGIYTSMIPPEAMGGQTAFDLTFDIYQLGLTLYRMANGDDEFRRQWDGYAAGGTFNAAAFAADVKAGKFPDRKRFPPQVPARLRKIIAKCLSIDPADRYASAIEVANALALVEGPVLDWRLTETAGTRTWSRNEMGTNIVLSVDASGAAECRKRIGAGADRRVTAMCRTVTDRDIATFLGST